MEVIRTPEERFANLSDYPFQPNYLEIDGLRMHYVDEGQGQDEIVLMLHGEPSWSYLYRKMIPIIVQAGYRAVVPDLIGFGKSDKPTAQSDYSYQQHVDWMKAFVHALDLKNITLVIQDWGGLIGLRLLTEEPERFKRITASNTGLPTGDFPANEAFLKWQTFSRTSPKFDIGRVIQGGTLTQLGEEVIAAYNAPFPDDRYKAGARIFPSLVPTKPDDPAAPANRQAWSVLGQLDKPFLTAFSDSDPITKGGERILQKLIKGTQDQDHITIEGAGHFVQEDKGEVWAQKIVTWMQTP
ncbi:MAG: haloalkane dehalogenase [Bacteroidota bacterium]